MDNDNKNTFFKIIILVLIVVIITFEFIEIQKLQIENKDLQNHILQNEADLKDYKKSILHYQDNIKNSERDRDTDTRLILLALDAQIQNNYTDFPYGTKCIIKKTFPEKACIITIKTELQQYFPNQTQTTISP